jgi:hypothetical protein
MSMTSAQAIEIAALIGEYKGKVEAEIEELEAQVAALQSVVEDAQRLVDNVKRGTPIDLPACEHQLFLANKLAEAIATLEGE